MGTALLARIDLPGWKRGFRGARGDSRARRIQPGNVQSQAFVTLCDAGRLWGCQIAFSVLRRERRRRIGQVRSANFARWFVGLPGGSERTVPERSIFARQPAGDGAAGRTRGLVSPVY